MVRIRKGVPAYRSMRLKLRLCQGPVCYARAMGFLYEKEFKAPHNQVAGLYQTRGHSTGTKVEANYAVWNALGVLKAMQPGLAIGRVLVVAPGLDFKELV